MMSCCDEHLGLFADGVASRDALEATQDAIRDRVSHRAACHLMR